MTALLETKNLTRHFKIGRSQTVHAVDDLSLLIAEREVVGLVGESGSGKSTFGKTLLGLYDKTSGSVNLEARSCHRSYQPRDFQRLAAKMQMIFRTPTRP